MNTIDDDNNCWSSCEKRAFGWPNEFPHHYMNTNKQDTLYCEINVIMISIFFIMALARGGDLILWSFVFLKKHLLVINTAAICFIHDVRNVVYQYLFVQTMTNLRFYHIDNMNYIWF